MNSLKNGDWATKIVIMEFFCYFHQVMTIIGRCKAMAWLAQCQVMI